jgi:hypothetical protein
MDEMLDTFDLEGLDDINESIGADEGYDNNDPFDAAEEAVIAAAALQGLASSAEINELASSTEAMNDISDMMGIAMERTIVRLDRKARLKHLTKQAELDQARANNDPNYKKLMKLWMMERALEKKIHQRWSSKAKVVASKKIRDYASNGKKIAKPNPSTVAFKGKVSGRVAQNAVNKSKSMFSKSSKVTAGR